MKRLFEYKVVFHPKVTRDAWGHEVPEKDPKDGELKEEVIKSGEVVADNEKVVVMRAVLEVFERPEYKASYAFYKEKLDQLEIHVRPFS